MSLLLGAELSVLFNSSNISTGIRDTLKAQKHFTLQFWIGMTVVVSIICTIFSLITTFTAWGMVSAISNENAHCILRSSIGQYVAELPGRFIVSAIYSFLLWFMLFIFLLFPFGFWSVLLVLGVVAIFIHVMVVFSTFGRLIMHTGCMGKDRIFDEQYERSLLPRTLQSNLYTKAKAELAHNTSITRQYRRKVSPLTQDTNLDDMSVLLGQVTDTPVVKNNQHRRSRTDSIVRFADTLWTSIDIREDTITPSPEVTGVQEKNLPLTTKTTKYSRPPPLGKVQERTSSDVLSTASCTPSQQTYATQISLEDWLTAGTPVPERDSTPVNTHEKDDDRNNFQNASIRESPSGESEAHLVPPFTISTFRSTSVASSFDDLAIDGDYCPRFPSSTVDEKFDLEYGELFSPSEYEANPETNVLNGFDHGLSKQTEEQRHLLAKDGTAEYNHDYGASANVNNK